MSIPPLSPRSHICEQIKALQPCHIQISQGQNTFKTEIDMHSDIREIFDDAVGYLKCEFNKQSGRTLNEFIVWVKVEKDPHSELFTTFYKPLSNIPIPDASFLVSEPGTPTNE